MFVEILLLNGGLYQMMFRFYFLVFICMLFFSCVFNFLDIYIFFFLLRIFVILIFTYMYCMTLHIIY